MKYPLVARATVLVAAAAVATGACGARSNLEDLLGGSGGTGGAPAGSSSRSSASSSTRSSSASQASVTASGTGLAPTVGSSAVSTGAGGAPAVSTGAGGAPAIFCDILAQTGSEIVVAQGIDHSASVPKFAALAVDGSDVELVVGMTPAPDQPPPMDPFSVTATELAPFGTWPPPIAPLHDVSPVGGQTFAVDGAPPSRFSLFFDDIFDPAVDPSSVAFPVPATGVGTSKVIRNGINHFVAFEETGSVGTTLSLFTIDDNAVGVGEPHLTCSDGTTAVDAARAPPVKPGDDRFLVAAGTEAQTVSPLCDNGAPWGPAQTLSIILVSSRQGISLVTHIDDTDRVAQVAMAPRSDGAWVVYQRVGADAKATGPIQALRIDDNGNVVSTSQVVGVGRDNLAAAALPHDYLAVAWVEPSTTAPPALGLAVLDNAGTVLAQTLFTPSPGDTLLGVPAVFGSGTDPSFVVGWSAGGGQTASTIHLARFGCERGM